MKNKIIILTVLVIVVGSLLFYTGMQYGKSSNLKNFSGQNNRQFGQGQNGLRNGPQQGGFANGNIISKDDKSITIGLRNGGSKIVLYSQNAEIGKFVSGTLNDIAVGESVMVNGTANPDGSITAQSIQIRPNQPTPTP